MLEINPGLIIWTIITFILLVFVLKKLAWKPLMEALQKREDHIRNSIEQAEKANQEAEQLLSENREKLSRFEEDGKSILNEHRAMGEKLKSEMLDKANQQYRKMMDQAKQEIDRDKEKALVQLRGEIVGLAIQAAGKILDETLDENKHRKIIDSYLKELPKN
jgi:F-type H+-transporting ATPase subunit b